MTNLMYTESRRAQVEGEQRWNLEWSSWNWTIGLGGGRRRRRRIV